MQSTRLEIIWTNPRPPEGSSPKVKRIEIGKFTTVYLVMKPPFTNRFAMVSKRAASSQVLLQVRDSLRTR